MISRAAVSAYPDPRQSVIDFMSGFSLETTPKSAAKIEDFRAHLEPGTTVYITYLAGADIADSIVVAKRLRREGMNPVPHLAARSIRDKETLDRALQLFRDEAAVTQVLLIGGGVSQPVGEFTDTMQLLETGLLDKHGIRKIGVAGHPEGSPDIPDEAIKQALRWKNDFARRTGAQMYVVTQFCFEADPIIKWDKVVQAEGNVLPIHIGIPGLATVKTLLGHAKACGIGPSMRFISRQAMNVAKLLTTSAPDRLIASLASYQANDPRCGIKAAHIFPLGGLQKSADWSYAVLNGDFRLSPNGQGFWVDVPN